MTKEKFKKLLYLSSVQLIQLNAESLPIDFASGALIDYKGKRLLLTVSHATGNYGNWSIQIKFVPEKGTQNYHLNFAWFWYFFVQEIFCTVNF